MSTSDLDAYAAYATTDEEERQFLQSLDSPKIEMTSVSTKPTGAGNVKQAFSRIADEMPPMRSSLGGSRMSLPSMFDTPLSKGDSVELVISDYEEDEGVGLKPPSPFKSKGIRQLQSQRNVVDTSDADEALNKKPSKGNLIELDDSSSVHSGYTSANRTSTTADLKGYLQKSKTQFERSLSNVRESSPAGKILAQESPDLREMVQPRRIPFSSPATAPLSSPSLFSVATRGSERPILYDLNTAGEKKSPHAGSFRSPLNPKMPADGDLDETIRSLESQLRSIESDVESKKAELMRLKRENAKRKSSSGSFLKRLLYGILFVVLFMLFDFTLRIIISK